MNRNPFGSQGTLDTQSGMYTIFRLSVLERAGLTHLDRLPFSIRILLESVLRNLDGRLVTEDDVVSLGGWEPQSAERQEVPFMPARVIMQDFTGVPSVVDLAAMRFALAHLGGDPSRVNPRIPVDLVIDHSVQVDHYRSADALRLNAELEFERNRERYEFLRWGQDAFENLSVVPPATGIVHQVNLEFLAKVVQSRPDQGQMLAYPDSLVGTDSHTTMINSLGVLGWGVGGIEAEAALLGQPIVIVAPEVVGVKLVGTLTEGTTATDLVLTITQLLRSHGVVGKFVEFFGPGLSHIALPNRATIANMAPEYGATIGFFPVDHETLRYLHLTGRDEDLVDLVERYYKEQGLYRADTSPDPEFSEVLELDLATVEPSVAGPKLPHQRVPLPQVKTVFQESLHLPTNVGGYALEAEDRGPKVALSLDGQQCEIGHGSVMIAAITSCTNTSNPSVMIGAGLLAKKAVDLGLSVDPYVKTSLAPGSAVVTAYLAKAGLLDPLAKLGFNVVGFGCTTCIGNSGPLADEIIEAINENNLVTAAVLSGNRNYEGRINPHVRASFLASPPLVVAYALAGRVDIDLVNEAIGIGQNGNPVYLRDIWPSQDEVQTEIEKSLNAKMFRDRYAGVFTSNPSWDAIPVSGGDLYPWSKTSSYIQEPPFFLDLSLDPDPIQEVRGARVLALLGDSVTTDHISPAGAIPVDSPAGRYLIEHQVQPRDFNSFGSRRGNDRVMTRGTFGNIRLKNLLVPGVEGGFTTHFPDEQQMTIFEAAMKYMQAKVPLIVLAGKEYGTGSSRDWAAKGTLLLGIKAVIAESYERIHRSNLVGMGVLPLQFMPGENVEALGLSGKETYDLLGLDDNLEAGSQVTVRCVTSDGSKTQFQTLVRIDTPIEVEYYRNGGILQTVLRQMARE